MSKKKKNKSKDTVETPEIIATDENQTADAPADPMAQLQAERDDLMARLQRTAADYANYQKRVQREMTEARDFANTKLIGQLLSVLDDMERALEAAGEDRQDDDPLLQGMQLVHNKALEILGSFGVELIEALGQPFDPEAHSALMQQPSEEHPPQTVLQELQRGYKLKGRTIRPTSVIVSTEPETPEQDETAEATAEDDNQ